MENEGSIDRGVRIVIGILVLSLTFFGPHTLWGLLGLIPLATGILGTCPLYNVLHINTCKRVDHPAQG